MSQATALDHARDDEDADDVNEPRILDHAYDGIQEFDNPLPGWWRMIFYGSIILNQAFFMRVETSSAFTPGYSAGSQA